MESLVGSAGWTTAGGTAIGSQGLFGAAGSFGAGGMVSGGSLLSGFLTGASAFSDIHAASISADALNLQARQSELSARFETIKGRQQALQIRNELERNLSSQNATFAARGTLAGEGSAAAASEVSRSNASEDINIATFGAKMGSESEKFEAAQYRSKASSTKKSGKISTIKKITDMRPVASLLEGI